MSQTPENETLQENLQRAAEGDEDAWRSIVEAYSYRVFGLIRSQCGNNELAEEITQSTFCTVVMKIGQYTEVGRFEAWLFRIAMNRLRDEMRRRKRQARPVEDEVLTSLAGGIDPDQNKQSDADSEQLANLRQAMQRGEEEELKVIQMRHYGGLSFAQIAQVLDQPIGTVLARQHRALKKLKELLGPIDMDS